MALLENIKIENFRGFDSIEINGFSKLNLFVGQNNSGKTSVLEAINFVLDGSNPSLVIRINRDRGFGLRSSEVASQQLKYLFHNVNIENKPIIKAVFNDKHKRCLEIESIFKRDTFLNENEILNDSNSEINGLKLNLTVGKDKHESTLIFDEENIERNQAKDYTESFSTSFISSNLKNTTLRSYDAIVQKNREEEVLIALQKAFGDNITSIRVISNGISLKLEDVEEYLPINVMGDGVRRFISIIATVLERQSSFVCIDEVENGLHYSAYRNLWKSLLSFINQNDIQLFITTHSMETLQCLKAVLEENECENMQEFAKVFAVSKTKENKYKAYRYSYDEFKTAIENDIDLRR